jgi:hypothetical protein
MVSVVALYAGKPELLARVEDATRVTQNTDKVETSSPMVRCKEKEWPTDESRVVPAQAVAMALAGARILERLILGATGTRAR